MKAIVEQKEVLPVFTPPFLNGSFLAIGQLLMVLWGAAGVGKSRIAHRIAHHLESLNPFPGSSSRSPVAILQPRSGRGGRKSRGRARTVRKPDGLSRPSIPVAKGGESPFLPRIIVIDPNRRHSYHHHVHEMCPHAYVEPTGIVENIIKIIRAFSDEAGRQGKIPFIVIDDITGMRVSEKETGQFGNRQKAIFSLTSNLPTGIYLFLAQARQVIGPYHGGQRPAIASSNEHHLHVKYRLSRSNQKYVIEISPISMLPAGPDVKIPAKQEIQAGDLEELMEMISDWNPLVGWTEVSTLCVQS